jgi:pyrroloquinoline-quinone synthase
MQAWRPEEFTEQLRQVGRQHYHDKHPFHRLMNEGRLDREQLRLWVSNRFYYQKNIPVKDALLLARCPHRDVRRRWVQRILDHDGTDPLPALPPQVGERREGGIEKWLRLGEAVGLSRDELESECLLLPGVRFAVDAYVNFVATRPWIEGVASSLTELFAPSLMTARLAAFETHYIWIDAAALDYFRSRPSLATRDSEHGLSLVLHYCSTRSEQERAVAALRFKCDVLNAQLDALYLHCVAPQGHDRHEAPTCPPRPLSLGQPS